MRKDKLIESVRQAILKQEPTQDSIRTLHPSVVEAEVSKAYNTALKEFYYSDINLMDGNLDAYSKRYELSVSDETYTDTSYTNVTSTRKTGRRMATLPAVPVALKKNLGLRSIKPAYGNNAFVRSSENEVDSIRTLDVFCCTNKVFYYQLGNKIYMEAGADEFDLVDNIHVKLIVPFEELEDSDNVEFPMGEQRAMQMLLELIGIRPTDNVNDDVR